MPVATIEEASNHLPGEENYSAGTVPILYFHADFCVPCRTVAEPVLEELAKQDSSLHIIGIDVEQCTGAPEFMEQYAFNGMVALPMTVVFRRDGLPFSIGNYEKPFMPFVGASTREDYSRQLEEIIAEAKK